MREEIKKKEMDLELNPDDLEQVSGGGLLDDLLARIENCTRRGSSSPRRWETIAWC